MSYISFHSARDKNFPDPETQIHLKWLRLKNLLTVTETNFLEFEHFFSLKQDFSKKELAYSVSKKKKEMVIDSDLYLNI